MNPVNNGRYEVHAIADAECTRIREAGLGAYRTFTAAKMAAVAESAAFMYGCAILDTETGLIDFGAGFQGSPSVTRGDALDSSAMASLGIDEGAVWSSRGLADAVLCLMDQGEITRGKAREMLSYLARYGELPADAPWHVLNWNSAR